MHLFLKRSQKVMRSTLALLEVQVMERMIRPGPASGET